MALPDIKDFRNKAAAAGLAGLMAIAPMGSAFAEDASAETKPAATVTAPQLQQVSTTSTTSTVKYYEDASMAASQWNQENRFAIAFAIRYGPDAGLTEEQLVQGLTNVAGKHARIKFFFEKVEKGAYDFSMLYENLSKWGLNIKEVVPAAQEAAKYFEARDYFAKTSHDIN